MNSLVGVFLLATILGTGNEFSWPGLNLSQPLPTQQPAATSALLAPLLNPVPDPDTNTPSQNWCQSGYMVMIPDGREGRVTSTEGDTCKVLAYGEAYVSIWTFDLIEPIYPQELPTRNFGH